MGQKDDAQVNQIDAIALGDGHDQRHHQHQGREDIQHAADNQQKNVQQQQECVFAADIVLDDLKKPHGHFPVHQEVCGGHGGGEDDQDAAEEHHALHHDGRQPGKSDVPIDEDLHRQHIEGRYRRGLPRHKDAAVNPPQNDHRQGQLPGRLL